MASPSPSRAAILPRAANAFAEQYTLGALEQKRSGARDTTAVIASRLEQLRQQALADSAAAQRYRITHNLLSTTQGTLTEQEISSYNQEVTSARAQAAEDTARLQAARAQMQGGGNGGVGEASLSPVIGQMRAQGQLAGEFGALVALWSAIPGRAARQGPARLPQPPDRCRDPARDRQPRSQGPCFGAAAGLAGRVARCLARGAGAEQRGDGRPSGPRKARRNLERAL
jgi:hypothetical protein